MGDTFFEIITPTRSIYAQYNGRAPRTLTVGETETFEFVFPTRDRVVTPPPGVSDLTVASDTTIAAGDTVQALTTTVQSGVTLTIDGTLETADLDTNGTVVVNGSLDVGNFERVRVESGDVLLVDDLTIENGAKVVVESGGALQATTADLRDRDVPAVWGLVDNVRDAREPVLSEKRIEVTVRILAPFDEYTDLSAVETAFEV